MTREEAIKLLQNEVACVQRETCERFECASCDLVVPVEKVLSAYDMAINALRTQQALTSNLKVLESNEPLTLDELRKMDGEPVWVQSPGIPEYGRWAIVEGTGENCLFLRDDFTCHDYGKTWLAYRRKPEDV